jgi:hypothetical protein
VKRRAAVAANLLRRILHAEPVSARGTFRSQTLHRPAGQILHLLPRSPCEPAASQAQNAAGTIEGKTPPETGGIVRRGGWCVKTNIYY